MELTVKVIICVLCVADIGTINGFPEVSNQPNANETFSENSNTADAVAAPVNHTQIVEEWMTQKLNHSNDSNDTRTWQMRYLSNDEYFVDGGPIFIRLGGEWRISGDPLLTGHFHDMAKEHNGTLFYLEHRYYGDSRPTPDLSTTNLKYLNVRQVLADIADFISTKKAEVPGLANSKVIMAGESYAGSLVVWFKRSYPHLIDGGWASSAPLLAKMDFFEYEEVVGKIIREFGSEQCYDRINNETAELEEMFATNRSAEAKDLLRICDDFDGSNDFDLGSLFASIAGLFIDYLKNMVEKDYSPVCDFLTDMNDDVIALVNFIAVVVPNIPCLDVSQKASNQFMFNTSDFSGIRQWYYQSCSELGWFHTSGSKNQPFGTKFPVENFIAICADLFGSEYSSSYVKQQIENTNQHYGGLYPDVKNIYMTVGEFDPWRSVAYQSKSGALIIPRAFHRSDVESISTADSPDMRTAKLTIAELVREWVK